MDKVEVPLRPSASSAVQAFRFLAPARPAVEAAEGLLVEGLLLLRGEGGVEGLHCFGPFAHGVQPFLGAGQHLVGTLGSRQVAQGLGIKIPALGHGGLHCFAVGLPALFLLLVQLQLVVQGLLALLHPLLDAGAVEAAPFPAAHGEGGNRHRAGSRGHHDPQGDTFFQAKHFKLLVRVKAYCLGTIKPLPCEPGVPVCRIRVSAAGRGVTFRIQPQQTIHKVTFRP